MRFDLMEAIDADRIAALVKHIASHVNYLVIALLPGNVTTLDQDYHRITEI
jgi:hypothetical protein